MDPNISFMSINEKGIDQSGFDQIFNQWYEPIRNFIYYKTGNAALAEDIAQDTFLKIWEKKDEVKINTIKAFLFTIANNLLNNNMDHQKVSFKFINTYQQPHALASPEFDLEMKEFNNKLQNALAELDDKKRTVFLMNRIDELTYKQIAENLGVTVKAIEKRMEKALAFLRNRIEMDI
ncbi:MAG: sigma-70 family RNA polymerase sigma factor [Bacteroidota bacterium]|nr:sigma-70 family RNA polymerase sigma factor [Bacteroidota bacterium]